MPRSLQLVRLAVLAALGLAAAAASPSGAANAPAYGVGAPRFVVSAAPAALNNADFAGEPSLGVSWKSGNALFQANTSTYKLRFDDRATPPTISWSDVSSPYSLYNMDPILATDPATGRTIAGGDDGGCAVMSITSDDGESWSPGLPCTGVIDHPAVGLGPFRGTPPAGASGSTAAYFCQQYPLLNQCSRSLDGGATWSPGQTVTGCLGLFGHIRVAPDGIAYVPHRNCAVGSLSGVGGFYSKDNGLSWPSYVIPGAEHPTRGFDPSVGVTTDGTLFEAWGSNLQMHPLVAVSPGGLGHWSKPIDLAGTVDPPLAGTAFHTVVAGGPGRAAVAFLGSRHVPKEGVVPIDDPEGAWDLFVSMTYDEGRTWTTTQVTTDPVQRGGISDAGVTAATSRNLLDFMDAGVTREGRVVVGFADGCIESKHCLDDGAKVETSTEQWATVAYQSAGRGLFAQYDR